jgi:hypothetical protein
MTAPDQQALGVVDIVVAEPEGGAQNDPVETARRIRTVVLDQLEALSRLPVDDLVEARYRRFRALGAFREGEAAAPPPATERPGLADRLRNLLDPGRWSGISPTPAAPRDDLPARDEV